jgi:hypothetical protein
MGIPYDKNVFVMVMALMARPCAWSSYFGQFGPGGTMGADVAGLIWMWSDENDPEKVGEDWRAKTHFADNDPDHEITYPTSSIARGVGPVGGLSMASEIFNGHHVDLLWPGTGPMTDAPQRAALKDLYQNMAPNANGLKFTGFITWAGTGRGEILPQEFVADDSIDPCYNGNGKKLYGVTCIGGNVVSLWWDWATRPQLSGFPASISALTQVRSIGMWALNPPKLVIPCEFGQLAELKAFVGAYWSGSGPIEWPAESCLEGLVNLEEISLGAFKMNTFPVNTLKLPKLQTVSLTRAPVPALPQTLSPNLRILKLSNVGASGPLPSFRGSALLEEIFLDGNNLQLGNSDAFDDCPKLRVVDVSNNNISAQLFRFSGSTNLESMDLGHNSIHGGIPSSWSQLTSCIAIRVSHNLVREPLGPLQSMSKIQVIDLSHNRVEWGDGDGTSNSNHMATYFWNMASPSLKTLILSYNLLKEPEFPLAREKREIGLLGGGAKYPNLNRWDLSHNFLTGIIDLETTHWNFDLSYNNLTELYVQMNGGCCTAAAYNRELYTIDWRHQESTVAMLERKNGEHYTMDQALNYSLANTDFALIEYMPRHNSFEQVELPVGTGRFPFSCPAWSVNAPIIFAI